MTPFYDAMIAKLIAHAPTREAALDRLANALDHTLIAGVRSNVAFLGALCRAPEFREGKVDTGFIDRNLAALGAVPHGADCAAAAFGVARLLERESANVAAPPAEDPARPIRPGRHATASSSAARARSPFRSLVDGEGADAAVTYDKDGMRVTVDGAAPAADARVFETDDEVYVLRHGRQTRVRLKDVSRGRGGRRRRRHHQGADAWQGACSFSSPTATRSPAANVSP